MYDVRKIDKVDRGCIFVFLYNFLKFRTGSIFIWRGLYDLCVICVCIFVKKRYDIKKLLYLKIHIYTQCNIILRIFYTKIIKYDTNTRAYIIYYTTYIRRSIYSILYIYLGTLRRTNSYE